MNDDWNTPVWLMNHFKNHFDPCPNNPQFDGLNIDWKSPSFVNPPYSNPSVWVEKAIIEQKKGINIVMLLRVDVSTRWYKMLMESDCHIAFFNERVKFGDCNKCPNFCSMLVYLEGK